MASLFSWHSYRSGLCTALFAAGCPDSTNQLICRWMCPGSLHVYRRMGTAAHAEWMERASRAKVEAIQSVNVLRVANDEGYAELFREVQSGNSQRQFMQDRATATALPATANVAPPRPASAARRPTPITATIAAPAPAGPVPALTRANAVGRRVLVPSALYPQYVCSEHAGAGCGRANSFRPPPTQWCASYTRALPTVGRTRTNDCRSSGWRRSREPTFYPAAACRCRAAGPARPPCAWLVGREVLRGHSRKWECSSVRSWAPSQ